ncbi:MAG: hypothetical protein ABIQ60_11950 [Burkholderiaceae bacterium]
MKVDLEIGIRGRILDLLSSGLVEHLEQIGDRPADQILLRPSAQPLGHRVRIVDDAVGIRGHDPVGDRFKRHQSALLRGRQFVRSRFDDLLDVGIAAVQVLGPRPYRTRQCR